MYGLLMPEQGQGLKPEPAMKNRSPSPSRR